MEVKDLIDYKEIGGALLFCLLFVIVWFKIGPKTTAKADPQMIENTKAMVELKDKIESLSDKLENKPPDPPDPELMDLLRKNTEATTELKGVLASLKEIMQFQIQTGQKKQDEMHQDIKDMAKEIREHRLDCSTCQRKVG